MDFGEAGEDKGFNLVTVEPGRPAKVEFKPLPCQKPLKVIRCDETNLEEKLAANREHPGFLKVIVELNTPRVGLAEMVRKVCPQTLQIQPVYPEAKQERLEFQEGNHFDAVEEFRRYYLQRQGTTAPQSVLEAFEQLHQEMSDAIA